MATQPEVREWESCVGVVKFGLFVCSLRLGVGSESDDDDSEDVSVGASGDGCVRNCGVGGSDAGLRLPRFFGGSSRRPNSRARCSDVSQGSGGSVRFV